VKVEGRSRAGFNLKDDSGAGTAEKQVGVDQAGAHASKVTVAR